MMPSTGAVLPRRREVVPSSVLGMLLFVGAEVMFFAGLISAFTITRAGASAELWTLRNAPLLPAAQTALNTIALLASGALVFLAHRQHARGSADAASRSLLAACLLGALFVVLQGREWLALFGAGLTLHSSLLGGFFYVIVGAHALHAIGALGALALAWWQMRTGTLSSGFFLGAQTFWYFVVGVWPVIYGRVYF
jgi:cytochrome c oxidase subunit 3